MPTSTSQERKTKTSSGAEARAAATATNASSTLIEFPGVPPKPQWRKELSERVREIQQRRALEAARETEAAAPDTHDYISPGAPDDAPAEAIAPPLGLVPPPPEAPSPNPLVVAALKRIERARQSNPLPPMGRASRGGAATAVAHVVEENYQPALEPPPVLVPDRAPEAQTTQAAQAAVVDKPERPVEAARPAPLAIVPPAAPPAEKPPAQQTVAAETVAAGQTRMRRHIPVVADEAALTKLEAEMHAAVISNHSLAAEGASADDHAPVSKRIAGGVIDLIVVAFASTPFAAIIELTNGNWADVRVAASMLGIVLVLMFLYLMTATALAGRTWGMSLVSLRTVDAESGLAPTTGQCIRRAFAYMLSLATLGIGLLYAFFDAEGRAAHDHLSGTIVIAD
jgi:uncharacterized RDD family membrane protein YckC